MRALLTVLFFGKLLILIELSQCDARNRGSDFQFTGLLPPIKRLQSRLLKRVKKSEPEPEPEPKSEQEPKSEPELEPKLEPEPEAEPDPDLHGVMGKLAFATTHHDKEDFLTVKNIDCINYPCTYTWHEDVNEDTDITISYMVFGDMGVYDYGPPELQTICEASRMPRTSWENIAWSVLSHMIAGGADGCNIKAGTYEYEEKDTEFYFTPMQTLSCGQLSFAYDLYRKGSDKRTTASFMTYQLPKKGPNCTETKKP
ncbi:uncharacterized protein LOC107037591 [Diachasma alloeum]|uniref:uncharacterized protein LOC107037591 n=1 Tax=Diachasma alloeum TaxID=454923 RepID=UPI000738229D|nr:uncharacterized protein LOC107037591 [Diachasma alloeum]